MAIDSAGDAHLLTMFSDTRAIEAGKPVGVDYFKRGIEQRRMELSRCIHVLVYRVVRPTRSLKTPRKSLSREGVGSGRAQGTWHRPSLAQGRLEGPLSGLSAAVSRD